MRDNHYRAKMLASLSAALIVILVSGCTSIDRIRDNPGRYAGRTVLIHGTVESRLDIPFTDANLFVFSDGENKTPVFSDKDRRRGDRFLLRGEVVAFPADEASEAVESSVQQLADFLVSRDIADADRAHSAADRMMGVIRRAASGLGSLFFIVET